MAPWVPKSECITSATLDRYCSSVSPCDSIQRYPDNFQTHTLVHRERPKHIPNLVYNSDLNSANHNYGLTYDANGSEQDIETGCKYTDL